LFGSSDVSGRTALPRNIGQSEILPPMLPAETAGRIETVFTQMHDVMPPRGQSPAPVFRSKREKIGLPRQPIAGLAALHYPMADCAGPAARPSVTRNFRSCAFVRDSHYVVNYKM
jgi:hypothetical protein